MIVSLIGYRGTGKSTVARHLALLLGYDWVDADVELELRAGKSIAAIFADDGEPAFRDLECAVIADLTSLDRTVLAVGGGAVLRPENRDALRKCRVIWLTAKLETILRRIEADPTTAGRRPNLTTAGGAAEVVELLNRRTPMYRACADLEVVTDDRQPADLAREIIQRLNLGCPP